MTWPTTQVAESSAARAWNAMTNAAFTIKAETSFYRNLAATDQLKLDDLRQFQPKVRDARAVFNQNAATNGLQSYARLASGVAAFDLSVELAALSLRFDALIADGRALFLVSRESMTPDGTVTPALSAIPAASCVAFIAACDALIAQIV